TTLQYLLEFLNAYDFVGDGGDSGMIVNASVLGKVFEKLNGYKDGSYYTPSFVTMGICQDSIGKTVVAKFNEAYGWSCKTLADVHNRLDYDGESIKSYNDLFNSIAVADISVGSGHFLVSALNEMVRIKANLGILIDANGLNFKQYRFAIENDELVVRSGSQKVRYNYQDAESQRLQVTLFNEKKNIISNCLFGVDINPNSVNICRLRLWIELLKHTYYKEETGFTELEILPNIDINIKVGNSLISKLPVVIGNPKKGDNAGVEESLQRKVREYKKAVREYKLSRDKVAKAELKEQIAKIKKSFVSSDSMVMLELDAAAIKFNEDAERNGLFVHSMEWMIEFPELMDEKGNFKGFDCIVGNPPYMRVQEIEKTQPKEKQYYESVYKNSTGAGAYDLAFIFVELALKLMRPGCICSYIMPHKFLNSDGAETFRNWLRSGTLVKRMAHFGANQLFKGASTYTCITEFSKGETDGFDLYKAQFKGNYVEEMRNPDMYNRIGYDSIDKAASLYRKNQWILLANENQFDVFNAIFSSKRKINSVFDSVFQGIATSDDKLFVLERNEAGSFTLPKTGATYQLEPDFFKPMLKGEDVHKWSELRTNRYVFFPYKKPNYEPVSLDELERNYPLTYKYVMENEKLFKSRESGKAGKMPIWYAYIYPKNKDKFEQIKLCSMEICSNHPNVTLNSGATFLYHNTKVYSWVKKEDVVESYKFLMAILNSNLIWWFLKQTGDTLSSDSITFKTEYLNPFPMPLTPDEPVRAKVETLVESIMQDTAEGRNTAQKEMKLNAMVYKLYGLTYNQVLSIDTTMSMFTDSEYNNVLE
ncbi:MAG: Eco57I restriction-modification methylase domain-containing protein, partial [Fibrobacteraceae bacterium]|nr:Eco57I restriction-modification methylase domain-containing protein [Fibrobacteraceae bacterium]